MIGPRKTRTKCIIPELHLVVFGKRMMLVTSSITTITTNRMILQAVVKRELFQFAQVYRKQHNEVFIMNLKFKTILHNYID